MRQDRLRIERSEKSATAVSGTSESHYWKYAFEPTNTDFNTGCINSPEGVAGDAANLLI